MAWLTNLLTWSPPCLSEIRESVVAELIENIADGGRIQGALDDIRACHEETTNFFSGIFDELDSLCESLLSQKQRIEKQAVARQNEPAVSETMAGDRWEGLVKQFEEDRAEFRRTEQVVQEQIVQLSGIAANLSSAQHEFRSVCDDLSRRSDELAAAHSQTAAASPEDKTSIKNKIRELEQQQTSLEKERAVLETELETVRRRAAEMADSLAEQKRLAAQQQNQWTEDLRQMRMILENLTEQFAASRRQCDAPPQAGRASAVASVASADPVLESVLAQFEILQQDRLRRRGQHADAAGENQ